MARNKTATAATDSEGVEPKRRFRRLRQILDAYRMTRKADRWVGWVLLGTFLAGWGLVVGIGLLLGPSVYFALLGLPVGVMLALIVFGRRAERAAYSQVEGQPGAAAAVMQNIRGWTITPAVAANRQQDLVSRAIGRPGIVLLGEGDPQRVAGLLATERKKLARYVPDAPIHEVSVGVYADQVPLRKVQSTLRKLPKALAPAQVTEVRQRLNALGGLMQAMPIPKGPMPKGGKVPRGKVR